MKKIKESVGNFLEDIMPILLIIGVIGICYALAVYTPLPKIVQGIHGL